MSEFSWPIRVYYEDTDAGGIVFYANYLKYMERARTEWLRSMGYVQNILMEELGIVFAVRRTEVDYLMPARLDDALTVQSRITHIGGASFSFEQEILRDADQQILCRGSIKVVCVSSNEMKPTAIPKAMREKFKHA